MKKIKTLLIINIIQIVVLIASIVAAVFVLPNALVLGNKKVPATVILGTELDKLSGYAQVTNYGAVANDGKDDTTAFKKALKTNASIYVPVGTYEIKDTLVLENLNLKGSGAGNTVIRFSSKEVAVSVSGRSVVEDITIEFSEKSITGKEKSGEKVAILDNGLTNGAMIRGVSFKNVGTGFLSNADSKGAFCTTIEAVTFDNYSYKAIEIKNALSTVIRSATVGKGSSKALIPVSLGGEASIESISFVDNECEYAIELKNASSAYLRNIVFNNTTAAKGFALCDSSRFTMQTVSVLSKNSGCLVSVNDVTNKNFASTGKVYLLYSNCGDMTVSSSDKISCDAILK